MTQINDTLRSLGLTDTETKIYLTGLNYQAIGVSELVKQTSINRTTIYHALSTLEEKGLTAKKGTGTKLLFIMTKPEGIENLLNEKIKLLEKQRVEVNAIIPLLMSEANFSDTKVNVLHYEGIEGIKLAVEDALYCRSRHWDIIAPIKNFFSEFDENYADYYLETRKMRGLTSRSLWERKTIRRSLSVAELKERDPRVLPEIMHGKFNSVVCIYDDKVLLINSLKDLSAIMIQSKDVHDTMAAIFEGLWSVSAPR